MNIEQILADMAGEASFDSGGNFGLAMPQLLERFAAFRFPDPAQAPLALVSAAVQAGAEHIQVEIKGSRVEYGLSMPEPDLDDPAQPLLWALAANRGSCRSLSLSCPARGQEFVLAPDSPRRIDKPGPGAGPVRIRLRRTSSPPPEALSLATHCGICPTPIRINGRPLQIPLARSYRGQRAAWSPSTPEWLRPPGPCLLNTDLALFLSPSSAPRPIWVAVVGAVSYPFLLPEAGPLTGMLWSTRLRTDLGLNSVVLDETWGQLRIQLIELVAATPSERFTPIIQE